jgi:hypothetical protein
MSSALERRVEVLEDAHHPRGLRRGAVGGDGHEVDLAPDVQVAHEVGQEQEGALEDADQQEILAGVVAGYLIRHLLDAMLQLVGLDEDLADLFAHGAAESRSLSIFDPSMRGGAPVDAGRRGPAASRGGERSTAS